MSRHRIQELIHELHQPGVKKREILAEIVKLKKALGDKVEDSQKSNKSSSRTKKPNSKSKKKSSKKKKN